MYNERDCEKLWDSVAIGETHMSILECLPVNGKLPATRTMCSKAVMLCA